MCLVERFGLLHIGIMLFLGRMDFANVLSLLGDVFSGGGWYPAGFKFYFSFVRGLFVFLVLCEFLLLGGIFSPEADKYLSHSHGAQYCHS